MRPTVLYATTDDTTPLPPRRNHSGEDGLWTVSGTSSAILRLAPTQLADTGKRDPATAVTTSSARLSSLAGVAFDAAGTLWVASRDDSSLLAFAPGALTSSGDKAARTVITPRAGSLDGPSALAFDVQRRLWVVNNRSATLVCFEPAQLAAGGAQAPAVELSLPGSPAALAFDVAGSLWVSDSQSHRIVKYTAAQLAGSGAPRPALDLSSGDWLVNPVGMAFDAAGNLWVANTGNNSLAAFTPAQLAGRGTLTPQVVLSATRGSLDLPVALAFDARGSLWVVGGAGALTKFAPSSLRATGAPAPSARLEIGGHTLFWSVALWPKPAGLPLN
jgi:sugar lactone lactonase YvrE